LVHAINAGLLPVLFGLAESGEDGAQLLGSLFGRWPGEWSGRWLGSILRRDEGGLRRDASGGLLLSWLRFVAGRVPWRRKFLGERGACDERKAEQCGHSACHDLRLRHER
jgi:hypothetical protein